MSDFVDLDLPEDFSTSSGDSIKSTTSSRTQGGGASSSSTPSSSSSSSIQAALVNDTLNELKETLVDALSERLEMTTSVDKKGKKNDPETAIVDIWKGFPRTETWYINYLDVLTSICSQSSQEICNKILPFCPRFMDLEAARALKKKEGANKGSSGWAFQPFLSKIPGLDHSRMKMEVEIVEAVVDMVAADILTCALIYNDPQSPVSEETLDMMQSLAFVVSCR
eukprot:TRINITY_DN833_c1_g1_i3.p1 TRINITY_DN833_c1_g1~~TRINITY_DN833_c1_g1_i3.p1  ORF type:complete len:224 (+),score=55.47 TRINITY_DN833_c1_g1_i3:104-775(+)